MNPRILKTLAIVVMAALPLTVIAAEQPAFSDINESPYFNSIQYVHDHGIVGGYDDGTYKPDQQINRAEFTKILVETKFSKATIETCLDYNEDLFLDVPNDVWFSKYVCVAKTKEIISGYDSGDFKPEAEINFVEASKILVNVFGIEEGAKGQLWYERFVNGLQNNNYIPPTVSKLDKQITRAEVAEMIWRIREDKTDQSSRKLLGETDTSDTTDTTTDTPDTKTDETTPADTSTDTSGLIDGTKTEAEFKTFNKTDYEFEYPSDWFYGSKQGKEYLSDEEDFIDNLNETGYMDVFSYVSVDTVTVAADATDAEALAVENRFDHKEIESKEVTINGTPALYRHFRAEEGDEVNGRTTQVAENIYQYTFRDGTNVYVLQLFVAYTREELNLDKFEKIAESFKLAEETPSADSSATQ